MRASYTTLIAILGQFDVGKTCFLSSLYLLASCRGLGPELEFAGSLTLGGFEARVRRLRQWKDGALPKQLVDHTIRTDPRLPALMHLSLREITNERRRFELLLTDLPGEWSRELANDAATTERFQFLKRADGIVLVLDGPLFVSAVRHVEVHRAELLLSRLAETVRVDKSVPLVLVVSKADELSLPVPADINKIETYAQSLGFSPKVIAVASISRTPAKVKSGTGVVNVIEYILGRNAGPAGLQIAEPPPSGDRSFQRIQG
jgi:hypothetical protein